MPRKHLPYGAALVFCIPLLISGLAMAGADVDFGLTVERLLNVSSPRLFGIQKPLQESALGPFVDPDNAQALEVAEDLVVSVVSNVTDPLSDMIALWPNDAQPTHVFVCVENSFNGDNNPNVISVQRVDISGDPDSNVHTIVKGLSSCDPIHRTPWGTLIVGEEAGETGGFYEILDPLAISEPIIVSSRSAGTTSDPQHLVKRKAVGGLSFEGIVILEDGTTYFGDELRPSIGEAGGAVYKFIPDNLYDPNDGIITQVD
jgi:hypothetical protein